MHKMCNGNIFRFIYILRDHKPWGDDPEKGRSDNGEQQHGDSLEDVWNLLLLIRHQCWGQDSNPGLVSFQDLFTVITQVIFYGTKGDGV